MEIIREIRKRVRHIVGPVLGISVITYFGYHVVHGQRGLLAWWQLRQRVESAKVTLTEVERQRQTLEHRVHLLHPTSLDPDMLEERARIMLNFGFENDLIVLEEERKK